MKTDSPWDRAGDYLAAGWVPLRFEVGKKFPPPPGCTGRHPDPDPEVIESWGPDGNIGVRLPEDVIGIDVDDYGDKRGGLTLAALEIELGLLPETAISTSRDGVSGIRFFRVPVGLRWPNQVGPDVEIIRHGHRYAMAPPSVHPEGRSYRWAGRVNGHIPTVPELAELPLEWVQHLTGGEVEREPEIYLDDSPQRHPAKGVHPDAAATVAAELARLEECQREGWGGPPWDQTTFAVACNLAEIANSRWSGYSLEDAKRDLLQHAPTDEAWGLAQHQEKWRSAVRKVAGGGRRPPVQDFTPVGDPGRFFGKPEGFKVKMLAEEVYAAHPSALTAENRLAIYSRGAYRLNPTAFVGIVSGILGDRYRPAHRSAAEEFTTGMLDREGRRLPERMSAPLLNTANGMLDLRTGALAAHSPDHLSAAQIPVAWDPEATCPTYERWLAEVVGGQADDLEEVAAQMLDSSRTPAKALFAQGPARSGKSTLLRLLELIAGVDNRSAVTLHQISDDRFAAANVYRKMLNVAADLSAAHVEDLSTFKLMTGDDSITGNRKYGGQFTFRNQALFVFSANAFPSVGESSGAYTERMKPFKFGRSFAGHEDPSIEEAMRGELPGILVRLVAAWQRRQARGVWLDTPAEVLEEFTTQSDRVAQFVVEECTVWGTSLLPALVPAGQATTKRVLGREFNYWAERTGGRKMAERKVIERLARVNGVEEVRIAPDRQRGFNVTVNDQGL